MDTMTQEQPKKKTVKYQWIKGDRLGQVVEVDGVQPSKEWLIFTDGTRINPTLIKEFLIAVTDDSQVLNIPEPLNSNTPSSTQQIKAPQVTQIVASSGPSVVGQMIEKMSKKNVVQIPIEINVNIPTPAIYAMLSEGMEEEDLNEEIMQVALSQLEINKLQEYIKDHITNFLNTYYGK